MQDVKKSQEAEDDSVSIAKAFPMLMGQCSGAVHENKPAKEIVEEMMAMAIETLTTNTSKISPVSKL